METLVKLLQADMESYATGDAKPNLFAGIDGQEETVKSPSDSEISDIVMNYARKMESYVKGDAY